jgi:hypothetical protein
VVDWPRSTALGSALNCTAGFGGGAGCSFGGGGGGGGGGGVFFRQPEIKIIANKDNSNRLSVRFLILNFAS